MTIADGETLNIKHVTYRSNEYKKGKQEPLIINYIFIMSFLLASQQTG